MTENTNNEVPSGEDQYLLGFKDAEEMEEIHSDLPFSYIQFISKHSHPEYIKGYKACMQNILSKEN